MSLLKRMLIVISMVGLSSMAWALDIDDAKDQGLVGETKSGYISAVSGNPTADIKRFVADINAKRKAKYAAIAKKRGIPLKNVEQLAAKKAMEKTKRGNFVQNKAGKWIKK